MKAINAVTAATHPAPYAYYASLVAGPPLIFDESLGLWVAASASAVTAVFQHPHCLVRPAREQVPHALAGLPVGEIFSHLVRMNDGEKHARPKIALRHALARLAPAQIDACTRNAILALSATYDFRSADTLSSVAHSLPIYVVAGLLGFDEAALPEIDAWMAAFVASLSPLSTGEQTACGSEAAQALLERFAVLATQEGGRQDSLIGLVQQEARIAGWHGAAAVVANLIGLMSQTYDATAGLIGNSIVALLTQPGLEESVRRDPMLATAVVEEVSRFDPPVQNTRRFVVESTSIGGADLATGDAILLLLAAASRDPQANSQPDEFLLDRMDRRVFAFGHGVHVCPGQALASSIAVAAINALLESNTVLRERDMRWCYRPSLNGRVPVFSADPPKESS